MTDIEKLDAYHFYEREWESYEELRDEFEWQVPETFNIASYVCDRWAEARKNSVAVYAEEPGEDPTAYSFHQLHHLTNQLANVLVEHGVTKGDRVGVHGTQRIESLITHLAAFKIGAVSVPFSVLLGPEGLRYRLTDSGVSTFVADEDGIEALRATRPDADSLDTVLTMKSFDEGDERYLWDEMERQPKSFQTVETDPEHPACIVYTSGTTGEPKGAVHAHRHLLGILPSFVRSMGLRMDDQIVTRTVVEWTWIASLNNILLPTLFYGLPVVANARRSFDPEREFELIEKYGITCMNLAPTAVRMLMEVDDPADRYDLTSIRRFVCGGESVGQSIIDWATDVFDGSNVTEAYGQTEAPALVGDMPELGVHHREGCMGVPLIGHDLAVLDPETLDPITEPGTVGELAVEYADNPMLFKEYWGKPEKTAEKVKNGWLLCEDLVSMDDDGYLSHQSRKDDVIISSGYRIGPVEIEESLATHDAVRVAGVIGVPDETRGEIPKAFVELTNGTRPTDELRQELQKYVRDRLAKYEYPREIEFVDELPRTSTDKIRRETLREWETERSESSSA